MRLLLALVLPAAAAVNGTNATPPSAPPPPPLAPFCQEGYPPVQCSSTWGICGTPSRRKYNIGDSSQICLGFQ